MDRAGVTPLLPYLDEDGEDTFEVNVTAYYNVDWDDEFSDDVDEDGQLDYVIRCSHCYYACQEPESFKYDACGVCSHCERYFNIEIHDDRTATHKYTNIDCPHCETHKQVPVHRVASHEWRTNVIQDGKDPIFHLQLYYLDYDAHSFSLDPQIH
ncbi:hypothetical protein [Paenibacillus terrae]|uniref:hypothetical protein n=1 Tax=Paenibacillus terrae TaxID=159743 RepID=UPI0021CCD715|nr:hypothetical protein [Paenibacillus terrae]